MSRPKKMAFVANSTWNIYNFRLNLMREMLCQGFQIYVIAPVDEYIHYLNKMPGVTHIPIQTLSRNSTNPYRDLKLLQELVQIYKTYQPEIVVHYTVKPNIWGNLAARICGIQSICVVTGLGYTFLHRGWIKSITKHLYRFSFRYTDAVVFENPDDQQLFIDLKLAKAHQCHTVNGCGVDTHYFSPKAKVKFKDYKVFTFVGRMLYDKGIVEFVEAAKIVRQKYPNAIFWVLGEIDEGNPSFIAKSRLVKWMEQQTIRYFGTRKDIRSFMSNADCIVLPSYREGLSKVLLEALAMGKPIITTDTAGCRQAVEPGQNGFLVPIQDANALSLALEAFCELPSKELQTMGQHSRQMALATFADEVIVHQLRDLIFNILAIPNSTTSSKAPYPS